MACAPREDSDQPGHPPSLIRVFSVRMKKASALGYPLSAQRRLWSDWADAFCWFCYEAARILLKGRKIGLKSILAISESLLVNVIFAIFPYRMVSLKYLKAKTHKQIQLSLCILNDSKNRTFHIWPYPQLGRPDSSVGKMVYLCVTTSYIPPPQGFVSRWRHASKKYRVVKTNINENPCGMYDWFDCPCRVAVVSQSISRAAENYPRFPPPQDSRAKCVFRSRIVWFDVDSVRVVFLTSLYIVFIK